MSYDPEIIIESFRLDPSVADFIRSQNREITRLQRQVQKLNEALSDQSWRRSGGDAMGGSFSADEIARSRDGGWI